MPSSSPALSRLAAPSRERPFRSVAAFVVQRSGLDRAAAAAHGANIEPPTRSHIPETAQRGGPCITVVLLPSPQRSAYLLRRRLQLTYPRLCFHALSNNCVDDDHPRRLNPLFFFSSGRRLLLQFLRRTGAASPSGVTSSARAALLINSVLGLVIEKPEDYSNDHTLT